MLRRRRSKPPHESPDVREAEEAVRKVAARDKKVQDSSSEIMAVVRELKEIQRRNNFVRLVRHALGGEGG